MHATVNRAATMSLVISLESRRCHRSHFLVQNGPFTGDRRSWTRICNAVISSTLILNHRLYGQKTRQVAMSAAPHLEIYSNASPFFLFVGHYHCLLINRSIFISYVIQLLLLLRTLLSNQLIIFVHFSYHI